MCKMYKKIMKCVILQGKTVFSVLFLQYISVSLVKKHKMTEKQLYKENG